MILSLLVFLSLLTGRETNYVSFEVNHLDYVVTVQRSSSGTDIILHGIKTENLSYHFPGENLFPEVQVEAGHFFVTWIHYQRNNVRLCMYDSLEKNTRMLSFSGFNFIGSGEFIFDESHKPLGLIFLGNNSGNDDLFLYNFITQRTKNLTSTHLNEKKFSLEKKKNEVWIRTETLDSKYVYSLNLSSLTHYLIKKEYIQRDLGEISITWDQTSLNSMIGYGDSITAGKMRMNDLDGYSHPELTYLARLQEMFDDEYGETHIINLGVGGASSFNGLQNIHTYFLGNEAFFCLILFGTNDVASSAFSADSSAENLEQICRISRDTYGMFPIISTVPPQKYYMEGIQFFKEQTETLNQKIIAMAQKNQIAYIDSYKAFFDHPDGWEACLEDIQGRHPSPTGHQVMADLFKPIILGLKPAVPVNVSTIATNSYGVSVQWDENLEFDFGHYVINFGFSAEQLDRFTQASTNTFIFADVPFSPTLRKNIYFKIQAIDKDGNASSYSNLIQIEFED